MHLRAGSQTVFRGLRLRQLSLSFSLIRDRSTRFMIGCHACNRRLRCGLNTDDRPRADLESGLSLGARPDGLHEVVEERVAPDEDLGGWFEYGEMTV